MHESARCCQRGPLPNKSGRAWATACARRACEDVVGAETGHPNLDETQVDLHTLRGCVEGFAREEAGGRSGALVHACLQAAAADVAAAAAEVQRRAHRVGARRVADAGHQAADQLHGPALTKGEWVLRVGGNSRDALQLEKERKHWVGRCTRAAAWPGASAEHGHAWAPSPVAAGARASNSAVFAPPTPGVPSLNAEAESREVEVMDSSMPSTLQSEQSSPSPRLRRDDAKRGAGQGAAEARVPRAEQARAGQGRAGQAVRSTQQSEDRRRAAQSSSREDAGPGGAHVHLEARVPRGAGVHKLEKRLHGD